MSRRFREGGRLACVKCAVDEGFEPVLFESDVGFKGREKGGR